MITSNLVVFNDSYTKYDGFKKGVSVINKQLKKHELRVDIKFLEDYGDDGEFAWAVSVVPAFYEKRVDFEEKQEDGV